MTTTTSTLVRCHGSNRVAGKGRPGRPEYRAAVNRVSESQRDRETCPVSGPGVDDQERAAASPQLPSDRQAGLAGTDDEHIETESWDCANLLLWVVTRDSLGEVDVCHEC